MTIVLCLVSFVIGEVVGMFLAALLTAAQEDDNGDKQ